MAWNVVVVSCANLLGVSRIARIEIVNILILNTVVGMNPQKPLRGSFLFDLSNTRVHV